MFKLVTSLSVENSRMDFKIQKRKRMQEVFFFFLRLFYDYRFFGLVSPGV